MALKNYKIDELISVIYQAPGAVTGLNVDMQVYDEAGNAFTTSPQIMAENSVAKQYKADFTPDAAGEWICTISDSGGGRVIRQFSVGQHNVDSVGGLVGTVNTNVNATLSAVQGVDAQLGGVDNNVVAVLTVVQQIDLDVDAIMSPPMIG